MKPKAKLVITDITWNAENQPKPGTELVFSVTVKNAGPEDLPAGVKQSTICVYVDRERLPQIKYNGALAVGESKTFTSEPWVATAGNHVITMTTDFAIPSPDNYGTGVTFAKNLRVAENALPVPEPAAAAGMNKLVFSDDFTTLDTIDMNATGDIGYKWYVTQPYSLKIAEPTDYEKTADGILLKIKKGPHITAGFMTSDPRTSAGWCFTHGYIEARFRMPAQCIIEGYKSGPAIWSMPMESFWSINNADVEMDWMEYWGDRYGDENLFTVSLHDSAVEYRQDGPGAERKYRFLNRSTSHHDGIVDDSDWHVMGWLWEEGRLTTYVDGKELMTQYWSKDDVPTPPAKIAEGDGSLKGAFSLADEQLMPMILGGVDGWPMEVDYLNIWQA